MLIWGKIFYNNIMKKICREYNRHHNDNNWNHDNNTIQK